MSGVPQKRPPTPMAAIFSEGPKPTSNFVTNLVIQERLRAAGGRAEVPLFILAAFVPSAGIHFNRPYFGGLSALLTGADWICAR